MFGFCDFIGISATKNKIYFGNYQYLKNIPKIASKIKRQTKELFDVLFLKISN